MKLTRRRLLSGLCVAAAGPPLAPGHAAALGGGPGPSRTTPVAETLGSHSPGGPLALVLTFKDGRTLQFSQNEAKNAGDYVGQIVRQKCYVQRKESWRVYFRPDEDGARDEVVIELGRMLEKGEAPFHVMEPFTATILKSGETRARIEVPYQMWWSRWRWQSAPRPVMRRPSDLIATKLLPPLGSALLFGLPPYSKPVVYKGPSDNAWVARGMGNTGDRDDIGLFTEPGSDYIIRQTAAALFASLAQAEATGSMPIHYRDDKTGAFMNFQDNPTVFVNESTPLQIAPGFKNAKGEWDDRIWEMNEAHIPNTAYLPYLLTDDPYYLEEVQALATFCIGHLIWNRDYYKLPGLTTGETRTFAWSIRSLFMAAMSAPVSPPSWLLAKSYWNQCIADNRKYARMFQVSPAIAHRVFHAFPLATDFCPWQYGYLGDALGFAKYSGQFPEWDDFYTWLMGALVPMATDGTGWSKAIPSCYGWTTSKDQKKLGIKGLVPDTRYDAETWPTWAAAFANYMKTSGRNNGPVTDYRGVPVDLSRWDGKSIIPTSSDGTMLMSVYGAFRLAVLNKVPGVGEATAWFDQCMPRTLETYGGSGRAAKWSFG